MEQKIDLFTPIHKAIRALIYQSGKILQQTDFSDPIESRQFLDQLENMLNLLEEHARHEDKIIFPPIEAVSPGISLALEEEHAHGDYLLMRLRELITEFRGLNGQARNFRSNQLNLMYTDFISFYLAHMNREEETVLPASRANLSNEELAAIRVKVQLDTKPEQYDEWLRWMLPALNVQELLPLFKQVRASVPMPIYNRIKMIGEQVIDPGRWHMIVRETEAA